MREIKFRAWNDTPDGEMVTEENSGLTSANILDRFSIVMQYTGLKDRNGVEIYEGDIIKFIYWWFDGQERDTELTGVISYNPELLSYELTGITNPEWIAHVGGKPGDTDNSAFAFFRFTEDDFEVIGNIHENPDLLKK